MFNNTENKFSAPLIVAILVVLFFGIITFAFTFMNNSKVHYIQNEIKEIKKEVIEIENNNQKLDKKFDNFNNQIKEIDNNIEVNNQKLQNLKEHENKTIDSFRNYTPNEWEKFFAERYK
jgi:peptidoglycan hydrolase CwlO-like protein